MTYKNSTTTAGLNQKRVQTTHVIWAKPPHSADAMQATNHTAMDRHSINATVLNGFLPLAPMTPFATPNPELVLVKMIPTLAKMAFARSAKIKNGSPPLQNVQTTSFVTQKKALFAEIYNAMILLLTI